MRTAAAMYFYEKLREQTAVRNQISGSARIPEKTAPDDNEQLSAGHQIVPM